MRASSPVAALRNGPEAVQLASGLCLKTEWKNSRSLDTLAAAYAEVGAFNQAAKTEEQALELHDMPAETRQGMQQRLDLYRQHKPFRVD